MNHTLCSKNPNHGAPLKDPLENLALDSVKLDPLAYCNHENAPVARLAAFYVNGKY